MKKFLGILSAALLLTSCTISFDTPSGTVSSSRNGNGHKHSIAEFINLRTLETASGSDGHETIYVDDNTGILYYQLASGYQLGITVIYNAEGKPMTLTEWKSNHK